MIRAGFVGLGVMGRPMAQRILAAAIPLRVTSRTASSVAGLVASGAQAEPTPKSGYAVNRRVLTLH